MLLDGRDLAAIRLADLRRQIALVSQEIVLFNDTIAANIAYGAMAGAPREAIERAAAAANALEFIRAQPEGFDTVVGERGIRLSGGQRQRIAIARAILKDAPILILDEATSALDTESERLIQAALDVLMRGRTTIVIAHRLSTIEHCDRIVVLERGRDRRAGHARGAARARRHLRAAAFAAVPRRRRQLNIFRISSPPRPCPAPSSSAGAPSTTAPAGRGSAARAPRCRRACCADRLVRVVGLDRRDSAPRSAARGGRPARASSSPAAPARRSRAR